jgi:hypothetical protein
VPEGWLDEAKIGLSRPVGTEVKGGERSEPSAKSGRRRRPLSQWPSQMLRTPGAEWPPVNWIWAFSFFLSKPKHCLVAPTPTQSQRSGQRVLRSCNPVVHSRNEPGWGNKAGWWTRRRGWPSSSGRLSRGCNPKIFGYPGRVYRPSGLLPHACNAARPPARRPQRCQ